jgi:hypothetical protein
MSIIKRGLRRALRPALAKASTFINLSVPKVELESGYQQIQRSLTTQYAICRAQKIVPYPNIRDASFRAYSQFEEDGIILYVLSMIGFGTKRVVEICCGTGDECMATNLILHHGYEGFLFEGDENHVGSANAFFRGKLKAPAEGGFRRPTIKQAWITAENVNELLTESGCAGEVDLLSIDLDGNDYWILKALDAISPRLIVIETMNIIPGDLSRTIPYRPDFDYRKAPSEDFRGVSLLAVSRFCGARGYRLIGSHCDGFNAFFLRNDEGQEIFPEVSIQSVHNNPYTRWSQAVRWPVVKDMPWTEV